ncbi:biotin-dependent carboxyltransferase family protein [Aeromicrobium stalagmiti]|uniref:5-oxoprolinase subunit C family protein n=1 Tax=Aeromicrobium stalagmiti TaxID=2738988 RepID=UPI0015690FF4|nr:biotin-dependent carboxyltransferase family protein [Aeromicrobium stalagmiti]NRQ49764.1 biotin-dependent carboxyltransferase family protein [Aeromicrobium stalagmiti]
MSLVVVQTGLLSLVQDSGRPGLGHLGVSTSGAFDRVALRQVNAVLGNAADAAVIEAIGGGLALRATEAHVVAVTGAAGPVTIDGRQAAYGRALRLAAGQQLELGTAVTGLRTYVAVAGGLDVGRELGSAATDTLAGLGPPPLAVGDELPTGRPSALPEVDDVPPLGIAGDMTLDVVLGPRDDWFEPDAMRRLLDEPWQVSGASDRVGVRLTGPTLDRSRAGELPSEPCVRGSVQVAADGQPIVFGPDHPVTGGYPVIAVVVDAHTDRLAQARPGQVIRFRRRP